jgi:fatty acid-binding protein DegV
VGQKTLNNIMTCRVILHNMIIEDERDLNLEFFYDNVGMQVKPQRNPDRIQAFLETYRKLKTQTRVLISTTISSKTIGSFMGQNDDLIHLYVFLFIHV